MKVKLLTNFLDYYDHHFDFNGQTFDRRNNIGMNRKEMFNFFQKIGIRTPFFGTLLEVFEYQKQNIALLLPNVDTKLLEGFQRAVVYLDLNSHWGEEKILVDKEDSTWTKYAEFFASEFIPTYPNPNVGISYKYLQIGKRKWWLRYCSPDDWRSNCGDVNIEVLAEEKPGYHPRIHYPLFSVDFVEGGKFYAVDFNQSPQLKGTGIENILKPQEVVDLIKKSLEENNATESS